MCFASSIVESHKKLFITAPAQTQTSSTQSLSGSVGKGSAGNLDKKKINKNSKTLSTTSSNLSSSTLNSLKMSRSKSRVQTDVCGDCGAAGMLIINCVCMHRT